MTVNQLLDELKMHQGNGYGDFPVCGRFFIEQRGKLCDRSVNRTEIDSHEETHYEDYKRNSVVLVLGR